MVATVCIQSSLSSLRDPSNIEMCQTPSESAKPAERRASLRQNKPVCWCRWLLHLSRTIATRCNATAFWPRSGIKYSKRATALVPPEPNRAGCEFTVRPARIITGSLVVVVAEALNTLLWVKWGEITQETDSIVASYFSEACSSVHLSVASGPNTDQSVSMQSWLMTCAASPGATLCATPNGARGVWVCAWDQFVGLSERSANKMWNLSPFSGRGSVWFLNSNVEMV